MSLVRIALRIAAVEALKAANTLVGSNVLDSELGALDASTDGTPRTDQDKPFIAVYTDGAKAGTGEGALESSYLDVRAMTLNGATEIIFIAGIAAAMTERDEDTGATHLLGVGIPATDQALEFHLDLVAKQIGDALTDPDNDWADIFRNLSFRFLRIERARTSSAEGQRMAAHQIKVVAELIDDPARGVALDPETPLARFLAKAATSPDPDIVEQATQMCAVIGGADADWKALQRHHGMAQAELLALGLGPMAADVERTTPPFTLGTIEIEGTDNSATVEP
ncbi:hypothetical protein [Arvimicrobium flavum]|uniref:hypothetical protein n=1 Tax=Arvimicrobium flavum TaxID=3393320 RepID=UPI00237B7FB5|nr:hypothetical protein [Mesorhizobium shangrilense]